MNIRELELLSWDLRQRVLDLIMAGGGGHIGGDMSLLNALLALYENHLRISPESAGDPDRDRFVLSKGHAMEAYYAVLCHRGFLDWAEVEKGFSRFGSPYIGHPNNKLPGVEMNAGSLGHGLPVCVGMALAGKRKGAGFRVYTIMGDGELAEGSVWEGAMAAGHYRLDNLCAVVDRNRLQISGTTEEVMGHEPLAGRFAAFGWEVLSVDGDCLAQLDKAYARAKELTGKPVVIIANTTKGYGAALMEGKAAWHHHLPTWEEYGQIKEEFAKRKEAARYA
ncbi:transketolase [Acutalibacter caecimuris]|uniref:transketolase n=1 Tax=Acutalibacter caecimuris TaxID=3093657 RepID=UPI003460A42F